jgi:hypothetical protein
MGHAMRPTVSSILVSIFVAVGTFYEVNALQQQSLQTPLFWFSGVRSHSIQKLLAVMFYIQSTAYQTLNM